MSKKLHVKFYYYSKVPCWLEHIKPFEHCLDLGAFDNEEDAEEEIVRTVEDLRLRNMLYSWHTVIEYVENKEENTMTNAEMAKQIKEFSEKLDRYFANQEETINKYDDKIIHLHNELEELSERVNGLGIVAQECPIAEHFCNLLENGIWRYSDGVKLTEEEIRYMENVEKEVTSAAGIKPLWTDDAVEKMARPILFSEFNAGKRAIVFDGKDPHFEAAYLEFWREFDEWCSTSEKNDKMYPQSSWVTRGFRMDPLMKCPSIYKDHASFAIWTEWVEEKDQPTFEYGTLMTDWREHKTVGGLPYTVWKI